MARDKSEYIDEYCKNNYGHTNWGYLDTYTKEEIVQELRSIIFDYQKTMTKDTEQALKNLIDEIEISNNNWPEGLGNKEENK